MKLSKDNFLFQENKPFFVTIPHSGEEIPEQAHWLKRLDEVTLMGDVDRYVDRLYQPVLDQLNLGFVKTKWHRYAADLNRLTTDVDEEAVEGSTNKKGTFPRGFHWVYNTKNEKILEAPLSRQTHEQLVDSVFTPFHHQVQKMYFHYENLFFKKIYHLDLHSMPSIGTSQHRDPGQLRADVVISDSHGRSCEKKFLDLVIESYKSVGLTVSYNWPYFGGRLTEEYGKPEVGHHVIQVELNRSLYMNEQTKKWIPEKAELLSEQLTRAVNKIFNNCS